jgi:hypothetical protein
MTTTIIILICVLLLVAYIFDLTASRTRIPSVILLLLTGWGLNQLTAFTEISIPDLNPFLPGLGTIGLILIVLEGSLELEFNRSKIPLIRKALFISFLSLTGLAALLTVLFHYFEEVPLKIALINAIPLCVISSAIAIPSVRSQAGANREFIVYESSLSDILGILFFNFMVFNTVIDSHSFVQFGLQLAIIAIISFLATTGLSLLLNKIEHHIKFAPIILLIILIYEVSKLYHLPSLLFILIFGLFIGNLDELKQFRWIQKLHPDELNTEVQKLRELVTEGTFLVRSVFFLLFGFLLKTEEILNADTFIWSLVIVGTIILTRWLFLKLFKLPLKPLLFIAPRGLITILLFVSILPAQEMGLVNKSLIIQVIILSALTMMFGLMFSGNKPASETQVNVVTE